ncbi:MAG: hypothetical protein IPJ79_10150 [Bacteroidetes bacterium]|nr:hypothetical protein [Bacteroidota bacterium]
MANNLLNQITTTLFSAALMLTSTGGTCSAVTDTVAAQYVLFYSGEMPAMYKEDLIKLRGLLEHCSFYGRDIKFVTTVVTRLKLFLPRLNFTIKIKDLKGKPGMRIINIQQNNLLPSLINPYEEERGPVAQIEVEENEINLWHVSNKYFECSFTFLNSTSAIRTKTTEINYIIESERDIDNVKARILSASIIGKEDTILLALKGKNKGVEKVLELTYKDRILYNLACDVQKEVKNKNYITSKKVEEYLDESSDMNVRLKVIYGLIENLPDTK